MLRIFQHIRKTLRERNKIRTYLLYTLVEILLKLPTKICPIKDYLWVEMLKPTPAVRALRYEVWQATNSMLTHIAYPRHAGFYLYSGFYQYLVPTEQFPSVNSFNQCKSVVETC